MPTFLASVSTVRLSDCCRVIVLASGVGGVPRQLSPGTGRTRLSPSGYGLGLVVTHDLDMGPMVSHGGGLPGYGSHMRWLPRRGVGVVCMANVTYARMGDLALELLEILHDGGVLPPEHQPRGEHVHRRVAELTALLNCWDDGVATTLFADNVLLDLDAGHRRAAAEALRAAHGPLRVQSVRVINECTGKAVLEGDTGTVALEVELSPHVPPRIQLYTTT